MSKTSATHVHGERMWQIGGVVDRWTTSKLNGPLVPTLVLNFCVTCWMWSGEKYTQESTIIFYMYMYMYA